MTIEFRCSQCQSLLRIPDTAAGKQVRCPKCSAVVHAPESTNAPVAGSSTPNIPPEPVGSAARGTEVNPYASPLHSPIATAGVPELVGGPLDVGYVLSRSWEIFKIHWGLCLVAALIPTGVQQMASMLLQAFLGIAMQFDPAVGIAVFVLGFIVMIPVMVWINIGQMLFFLRVAQGEQPEIRNMFRGAPWILSMIGLWLLMSILLNLALWVCIGVPVGMGVALGAALGEPGGGALFGLAIGGVVGAVALVYLVLAYSQGAYLLIDRNTGVIDALRGSWQMTQGNKLAIFLVFLVAGLINLAGLAACCIGMIATMPYTLLAIAVMYTVMAKGSQQGEVVG